MTEQSDIDGGDNINQQNQEGMIESQLFLLPHHYAFKSGRYDYITDISEDEMDLDSNDGNIWNDSNDNNENNEYNDCNNINDDDESNKYYQDAFIQDLAVHLEMMSNKDSTNVLLDFLDEQEV